MSFYATLPGLPAPLFTFGLSTPADKGRSTQPKDAALVPSLSSRSDRSSSNLTSPAALKYLAFSSDASDNPKGQHPSLAADFIIEVRSARLNPVELVKWTPPRAHDVSRGTAEEKLDDVSAETNKEESDEEEEKDSDEDYYMYDYSNDFSTPNDDEMDVKSNCADEHYFPPNEFDLSITLQGQKYNATRAFSTFVKLRNDLLREVNTEGNAGGTKHILRPHKDKQERIITVPELPRVSLENYCLEIERWMTRVVDNFPCSPALSNFLLPPPVVTPASAASNSRRRVSCGLRASINSLRSSITSLQSIEEVDYDSSGSES